MMHSYDKIEAGCQDVDNSSIVKKIPQGSAHTTCISFFKVTSLQHSSKFTSAVKVEGRCSACRIRSSYAEKRSSLRDCSYENHGHYFELIPESQGNSCSCAVNEMHLNPQQAAWTASLCRANVQSRELFSTSLATLRTARLTMKSLLIALCLIFVFSSLCAEAAPAKLRTSIRQRSLSLDVDSNITAFESNSEQREVALDAAVDIDFSSPDLDVPSVKTKRSSGNRRGRKGSRRGGRKNRRKRKGQKGRKTKKPSANPTPFPDIINGEPRQHEVSNSPRRQRLYNKMGNSFHLAIWRNGTVSGETSSVRSNYSILEIRGVNAGGVVTIRGASTKRYICVSKKGVVKAKRKYKKSRCRFMEKIIPNNQNTYESLSCKGCFLNLNKLGKVKRLKGTNPNMKQAHFLPRRSVPNYLPSTRGKVLTIDFNVTANEFEDQREKEVTDTPPTLAASVASMSGADRVESDVKVPARAKQGRRSKSRHSKQSRKHSRGRKNENISTNVAQQSSAHDGAGKKGKEG